jgi:hypothetical protein
MGDRWKAEIALAGGGRAPIQGQAGAAIPSTALITGRKITVTGIVRRPYPTATDRRFAVLPRDRGDVAVGPGGAGNAGNDDGGPGTGGMHGGPVASAVPGVDITPDTDLAVLADHVGERVRVGGLIERLGEDGFDLDDGTALAHVQLTESMAAFLPHLHPGEAIAATGLVELVEGAAMVIVDDDGTLFRVGSLGQALPVAGAAPRGSATTGAGAVEADATGLGPDLTPTSIFAFAGLALLSVAATFARRRLVQRRLRGSLVARLSALRAGPDEPAGELEAPVLDHKIGPGHAPGPAEPEPERG